MEFVRHYILLTEDLLMLINYNFGARVTVIFLLVLQLSNLECFSQNNLQYNTWRESGLFQTMRYKLYAPKNSTFNNSTKVPLIIALHGCKQSADIFAQITRLNKWADNIKFLVLYPEQTLLYNIDHCWNWFLPINQKRSPIGELATLSRLVESLLKKYPIDNKKIYVIGLSAGAAMANLYAHCYIDQVAGVAIHSGLQFSAANDPLEANEILLTGSRVNPEDAAHNAFECSKKGYSKSLRTVIITGTEDKRLNPIHSEQILQQSLIIQDYFDDGKRNHSSKIILQSKKRIELANKYPYLISNYGQYGEVPIIKFLQIEGMAHAWSGGPSGFNNSDPKGVDATDLILGFFLQNKRTFYAK